MVLKFALAPVTLLIFMMPLLVLGGGEIRKTNRVSRNPKIHFSDLPDSLTQSVTIRNPSQADSEYASIGNAGKKEGSLKAELPVQFKKETHTAGAPLRRIAHRVTNARFRVSTQRLFNTAPPPKIDEFALSGFLVFVLLAIPLLFLFLPLGALFGLLGLTLSVIGLCRILVYPDRYKGLGFALFPIIISLIIFGIGLLFLFILYSSDI